MSSPTRRRRVRPSLLDVIGCEAVPELPEVETVRRRLAPILEGRRLEAGRDRRPARSRVRSTRGEVARELEGERVACADRRGKYSIVRFESGVRS